LDTLPELSPPIGRTGSACWRINRRSDETITDLARFINPIVQGWINYYGRFYKSRLYPLL